MNEHWKNLFTPVQIGSCQIKNRFAMAPMGPLGLGDAEGGFNQRGIDYYTERAKGGTGLIITGVTFVENEVEQHGMPNCPCSTYNPVQFVRTAREMTERIHAYGAKVFLQMSGGFGRVTIPTNLGEFPPVAPSPIPHRWLDKICRELTKDEIHYIVEKFGDGAYNAQRAGFDGVEIHAVHEGYLIDQFAISLFNNRTDEYGGTADNRARFAVEAVSAVREKLPDMPIDYKLAVRQENPHYGNAGVIEDELKVFVPMLEKAGVTSFHVTLANHSDLENTIPPKNHPYFGEPGCFLKFCDEVRQYTNLPICGVGGLTDPDFVEKQLADGRIQCAAMSRQLLADPDWVNKLKDGHADQIHRCVRCNKKCLGGLMQHQATHCLYEK